MDLTRVQKFEAFVASNLPKALKKASSQSLGDRSKYVGSSDIGGCLRKAYLDKISEAEYDLATLIRFQRGHLSEGIVETMLDGLNFRKQAEFATKFEGFELKSHIDFLLEDSKEFVVVEAKSVQSEIEEAYPSWVSQVQFQLHLLKQNTAKPVRAFIIALNINTGWFKVFDIAYNEPLAKLSLANAKKLIEALQSKNEPQASEQLYCGVCPHKATCPLLNKGSEALSGDAVMLARRLVELNSAKSAAVKAYDEAKAEFEELMRGLSLTKVKVDENFISLTKDSQSIGFDTKAFESADKALYDELFVKFQKVSNRKGYLKIQ